MTLTAAQTRRLNTYRNDSASRCGISIVEQPSPYECKGYEGSVVFTIRYASTRYAEIILLTDGSIRYVS